MSADAPTLIVADTHVHFYHGYDLARALHTALARLPRLTGGVRTPIIQLLCLTERSDCHFFRDLRSRQLQIPGADFQVEASPDPDALLIRGPADRALFLLAGRQIISREKIEVLALTRDAALADGLPIRDLLPALRAAGAVPVLSWAPGKWFFRRGRLVRDLIDHATPNDFLVGDTTLRPIGWPEPGLMRRARARGLRVVAGSDPLPFPGQESVIGQYGIRIESTFDRQEPARAARRLLLDPGATITLAGRRGNVLSVLHRLKKNHDRKKRAG